ncbi:MAG: hypothetical protein IJR02_12305 [Bacteroidaceae bacterium]|nr:hypothetical protein [Bacteroidaceae bacterium]
MMMATKVFLDANVLIDVVQNRADFVESSSKVLQMGLDGDCELWASDITMVTVSFYAKKNRTTEQLYEVMKELRSMIHVASTGAAAIDWALQQGFHDFEDAVQYYAASHCGTTHIITRNERDYPYSEIPVVPPLEFLRLNNAE